MSTQPPSDAELFLEFLRDQLADGANERVPEKLVDLWRAQRDQDGTSDDAIQEGIKDMRASRLHAFDEVNDEVRKRYSWSS